MSNQMIIVASDKTRYAYDVRVWKAEDKSERTFEVHANNRAQAAAAIRKLGFYSPSHETLSINRTG